MAFRGILVAFMSLAAVQEATGDEQCQLQLRMPQRGGGLAPSVERGSLGNEAALGNSSFERMQQIWTTAGHFPQCGAPSRNARRGERLLQIGLSQKLSANLPDKVTCEPGAVPIGNFENGSYTFSCCSAGAQCGGCRSSKNGTCLECAAGYVKQTIPVLDLPRCFLCDDVPKWHDAMSRTCWDYGALGLCNGSWPNQQLDVAYHGIKPSEACCVCGGGSVQPSAVQMDLATQSLYKGQAVQAFPEPLAVAVQVNEQCNLAQMGLQVSDTGIIAGKVKNDSEIKCSILFTQDPIRGIFDTLDLAVPVSDFSYGQQVLSFQFWGLDAKPATTTAKILKAPGLTLQNYELKCVPECDWLEMDPTDGHLTMQPNLAMQKFPTEMRGSVSGYQGMASCSCEASAESGGNRSVTDFVALQARMWRSGTYGNNSITARIGENIEDVQLLEDPGPGWVWYTGPDADPLQLPVLQNVSSGERFVVSPAIAPTILDVNCKDTLQNTYAWSRITGDVTLRGQVAFNLNPESGGVSGTPSVDLADTQGRANVTVRCEVALGGPSYDKVLPVAKLEVLILDDVCWVPSNVSSGLWSTVGPPTSVGKAGCIRQCRLQQDCAAVKYVNKTCNLMVSAHGMLQNFDDPRALVRLNNCSEDYTALNLSAPSAWYVQGHYSPSNSYKHQESYSRAGSTEERQFNLVQGAFVESSECHNSTWQLLHINSSDFKDGDTHEPEYFGAPMACIYSDVVAKAFEDGEAAFQLHFLPSELENVVDRPAVNQLGSLSLRLPACEKPKIDAEHFVLGSAEDPGFYSLHVCECFGEAYSSTSPVQEASNDAVPRTTTGNFNNGSLADQLIFNGPFTCEGNARLSEVRSTTLESCQKACRGESSCHFYQFQSTSGDCLLFESCNYMQRIDVAVENVLYGLAPEGHYCRIADPDACWSQIKRRSLLSLTPSNLPQCVFQSQLEQCDALQMIAGQAHGQCTRCEYLDATTSYARQGMQKLPAPDEFPAASQVSVSCNDTSRMFAKSGLGYEGPKTSAIFTCVSGDWVGEPGPWQLANLSCEECLQLGTRKLQELSLVSMPEVYFLEHREIHVTHGTANPGCASTGPSTPAPLLTSGSNLHLTVNSTLKLNSSGPAWFLDEEARLCFVDSNGSADCVCEVPTAQLKPCPCSNNSWIMARQVLMDPRQSKCAFVGDQGLQLKPCNATLDTWYFASGDCFVGLDMVDTAAKTWNITVTTQEATLEVKELQYDLEITNRTTDLFQIRLDQSACVEVDWSCTWTGTPLPPGTGLQGTYYCMKVSGSCTGAFGLQGNGVLRYYPHGDLRNGSYYLWAGCIGEWNLCGDQSQTPPVQLWLTEHLADAEVWEVGNNYIASTKSHAGWVISIERGAQLQMEPEQVTELGSECSTALVSMIAGPIQKVDDEDTNSDYQQCGRAPSGVEVDGCQSHSLSYPAGIEKDLSVGCPGTQALHYLNGHFASDGYYPAEDGTIYYECCDVKLPPRTVPFVWGGYRGTAPDGHEGDYTFSCWDKQQGVGFISNLTWARHQADSALKCLAYYQVLLGTPVSLCNPDAANSGGTDCFLRWRHFKLPKYYGKNQTAGLENLLATCESSVSIVDAKTKHEGPAQPLKLLIQNQSALSAEQVMAYTSVPTMQVQVESQTLFSCRRSPGGPVLQEELNTTLCAKGVPISTRDLLKASGVISNLGDQSLLIGKTCPVLLQPSETPQHARVISEKGLTMDSFFNILKNQVHYSVPFSKPSSWPFDYTGTSPTAAHLVGFLSLSAVGEAFWGIKCPPGAVVASHELTLPFCLQIGAKEKEQVFDSFSGSASCPLGSAVSGWYNLPAVPVLGIPNSLGGPSNSTGLLLFCRETSLLSFCAQPQHSHCSHGHIVSSISYDSNNFKLGCCQLQSHLGLQLTKQSPWAKGYQGFEGYYCPSKIDRTGAAVYTRTLIPTIGDPHYVDGLGGISFTWTLSWDNFRGTWQLRVNDVLRASVQSGDVVPVDINATSDSPFSATFIRPLSSGYLVQSKVKGPFPQKKPSYPKLVEFHSTQPDYTAFCDPMVLQNPGAFQVSVEETNPCYHTFNAELVKGVPEAKGISEQAFWSCAERDSARQYAGAMTKSGEEKADYEMQQVADVLSDINLALQLVAGVAGMIPWGSYAAPGEKGAEKGGDQVKKAETKAVEKEVKIRSDKEVKQELEQQIKKEEERAAVMEKRKAEQLKEAYWAREIRDVNAKKLAKQKSHNYMATLGEGYAKYGKQFDAFTKLEGVASTFASKLNEAQLKKGGSEKTAKKIQEKTMPDMDGPQYKQTADMAKSNMNDCMPLQFGLSKVMCDLFCVQDSVREGTSAILSSLEGSQQVLMKNLQALLNYQTEYILWAIGTVINQKPESSTLAEIPSASGLLEELRHIDFEEAKSHAPSISREVLDWHRSTSLQLYDRMSAMSLNASAQNWPYRVRAMRGMLQHFQVQFRERIYRKTADRQMRDKLQLLRADAAKHRYRAEQAQLLHFQMNGGDARTWTSLLESFLHCHEKHTMFTMMQLRALDQHDVALNLAQNFSHCKADTADLRETWQRAMRAEERSKEALLEAWSATVTLAERLQVAFEEEDFLTSVADFDHSQLRLSNDQEPSCHSMTQLAQELYVEAVSRVDRALKPLAMQLIVFDALAKYQEQHLIHQQLDYIPLPNFVVPKEKLSALVEPYGQGAQGMRLTVQMLQHLGAELCPAPPGCPQGMLLPQANVAVQRRDEVRQCSGKDGGQPAFVGSMTWKLAQTMMMNVTLEPMAMMSLSLLELANL